MTSFEAIIKFHGLLGNAHVSNARHLIVSEVPDFSAGVSQYLLVSIKVHEESDDSRLTSS
jgi:hypothetical protein